MRNLASFFVLTFALSAFFACGEKNDSKLTTNPNLTDTSALVKDSVLVAEVDTMIEDIYKVLRTGVDPVETPIFLEGDTIDMSYYDLPGGYGRWDVKHAPEGYERYPTIFLKDGEPIMFRYREWNMAGNIGAGEVIVYLKDGKIFYAKERSMPLAEGQSPAYLVDKAHSDSKRSRKDLWELMQKYYPNMKEAWENASRGE